MSGLLNSSGKSLDPDQSKSQDRSDHFDMLIGSHKTELKFTVYI